METPVELDFTVTIHDEGEHGLWAEVAELPGVFASGFSIEELETVLVEAISLYLSEPERRVVLRRIERVSAQPQRVVERFEKIMVPCA